MLLYIISKNLIYFVFWILKHVIFLANWMYAFLQKSCSSEYALYINNKRNVMHSFVPGLNIITTFDWLKLRSLKKTYSRVLLGHITGCD